MTRFTLYQKITDTLGRHVGEIYTINDVTYRNGIERLKKAHRELHKVTKGGGMNER